MKKKSIVAKILSLSLSMMMAIGLLAGCGKEPANAETTNNDALSSSVGSTEKSTESNESEAVQPSVALEDIDFSGVEFRIGWWGGDARHNSTLELLKDFQSKYKNLTVKEQYTGFTDYFAQIETQLTGNIEPDLYQMDWSRITSFAESNQLLDLTPYIESGALDLSNVDADTIAIGEMNGGIYGIATGVNAPLYIYSTDVANKAGVTINKTMTWDELVDVCKKVYDATGAMSHFLDFEGFVRACGETMYTEDGSAVGFTAETLADFWTFQTEGMEYGFLPTPENAPDNAPKGFVDGEYWLDCCFTNQLKTREDDFGMDLDWFAYPITEENAATSFLKPNCLWVIKSDTEQPDLAVAFLNYWVNNIKAYEICGIDRGFPISSEVVEALTPTFDDADKEVVEILNYLSDEELLSPIEPPAPAKGSAALSERSAYDEQIYYRLIDKADFLSKAEECIDKMNKALQSN